MDILKNKPRVETERQFEDFLSKNDDPKEEPEEEKNFLDDYRGEVFFRWQAQEFETYERDQKWYAYAGLVLIALIGYAVYTNSPVPAILFILIGVVGYIYLNRAPRTISFAITDSGVIADKEIYEFEQIHSFWIFYDPPQEKMLSLRTKSYLLPFAHIPLDDQDPVRIREVLLEYIPEVKQKPNLADVLERLLRI